MAYANTDQRKCLIAGLRKLADFLEESPEVPSPPWAHVLVFPPGTADREALKEIDAIAALIGAQVEDRTASNGHYAASRSFGPVEYRAVAIPASSRAYHEAQASYAMNVIVSDEEA